LTSTPDAAVRPAPRPNGPVELRLALSAFAVATLLSVPALGVSWIAAGTPGLVGAAIGTGVVAGGFLISAGIHALALPFGPMASLGASVAGYVLRLLFYAVLLVVLLPVGGFSRTSLAISAAVVLVLTLAYEIWLIGRTQSFSWIDPSRRPAARPERTAG